MKVGKERYQSRHTSERRYCQQSDCPEALPNVILKDFTILYGGHFGILATGVDNLTIDNIKMDTNRDGMDIDGCQNVRISNCSVNSPYDDAICLKSSYALGYAKATQNVTITNCQVSGYDLGTFMPALISVKSPTRFLTRKDLVGVLNSVPNPMVVLKILLSPTVCWNTVVG